MRICLVTPYDLSHDGGVNRHVITLAQALRRLGNHVQVLGPASGATPPTCDGLRGVVSLPANGSRARIGLLASRRAVSGYLQRGQFDLVHVHEPWVPGVARQAVNASQVPVVGTFHTFSEDEWRIVTAARCALARPLRRLALGVAVSKPAARFARRVYVGPMVVLPNGIDPDDFAEPVADRWAGDSGSAVRAPGPLRLLFVGRFNEPRKGLRHLLAAAALLRDRGRSLELRVVGPGDPSGFGSLAVRAGARFVGRVDDRVLPSMYHWSDLFCAPSTRGESFGLVLIEAMASGRPVVASDIPGYRNAAAGAAVLVPAAAPEALAAGILRVADDERLRESLVRRGLQRAQEVTWSRVAMSLNDLYTETVAWSRPGSRAVGFPA